MLTCNILEKPNPIMESWLYGIEPVYAETSDTQMHLINEIAWRVAVIRNDLLCAITDSNDDQESEYHNVSEV